MPRFRIGGGKGGTTSALALDDTEITQYSGLSVLAAPTDNKLGRNIADTTETRRDISTRSDFNSSRTTIFSNLSSARTTTHTFVIPGRWKKYVGSRSLLIDWTLTVLRPQNTSDLTQIPSYKVEATIKRKTTKGSVVSRETIYTFAETPDLSVDHSWEFMDVIAPEDNITEVAYEIVLTYSTSHTASQSVGWSAPTRIDPAYIWILPARAIQGELDRVETRAPFTTDKILFGVDFPYEKSVYKAQLLQLPGMHPPFETETQYEIVQQFKQDVDVELVGGGRDHWLRSSFVNSKMAFIPDFDTTAEFGMYRYNFKTSGSGTARLHRDLVKVEDYDDTKEYIAKEFAWNNGHFSLTGGKYYFTLGWQNTGVTGSKRRLRGHHEFITYKKKTGTMIYPGYENLLVSATNFSTVGNRYSYVNLSRRIYLRDFRFIIVDCQLNDFRLYVIFKPIFWSNFQGATINSYRSIFIGVDKITQQAFVDDGRINWTSGDSRYLRWRLALGYRNSSFLKQCDKLTIRTVRKNTTGMTPISTARINAIRGVL